MSIAHNRNIDVYKPFAGGGVVCKESDFMSM